MKHCLIKLIESSSPETIHSRALSSLIAIMWHAPGERKVMSTASWLLG